MIYKIRHIPTGMFLKKGKLFNILIDLSSTNYSILVSENEGRFYFMESLAQDWVKVLNKKINKNHWEVVC